ncbi:MAG TPA: HNH endonuclease [Bacteroidales bacterium]|nr:HNH endonuclease [Bacteroidales bacterium]
MASKFLKSLTDQEYKDLTTKLFNIQNGICYICQQEIDLQIQNTNIDHIIPLANKGKDSEDNFALTHETCNKSKQDANLTIARVLHRLKHIQEDINSKETRAASLKDVLNNYGGSKFNFQYNLNGESIEYSFDKNGDTKIYKSALFKDLLSDETSCFIEVPIEFLFHDELINPRGINSSINLLVKEFYKGNPQLHLTLARIDDGKIKVFDGQHKAVAQILLGSKKLLVRLFIDPNIDRLTETNTNAGSSLRQIAFDKSIMRQLNNTLYFERVRKYQTDHTLQEDCFDFSEEQLVEYFKGENVNIKKYIIDSIKHSITYSKDNKLKDYIDFEGKAKGLPISYSAFDKTFLSVFIDSKLILKTNISYKSDEGLNPRELEISQIVRLLNIIAEEIYINKFNPEIGVYRIEQKIIDKKDIDITDDHLVAYRISKEEIMYNWLIYLRKVIENYFINTGKIYESNKLFQFQFPDQLWNNIRNFLINLKNLPLWKDRSMASTIFSGKNNYDYWKTIFETSKTSDNVQVIAKPLNFVEMIKLNE